MNDTRNRILRLPSVEERTGYKKTTLYKMVKEGEFPSPLSLGPRAVGWLESEIDAWIEERVRQSRKEV